MVLVYLFVDATNSNGEQVLGYIDISGIPLDRFNTTGFIKYLTVQGYKDIRIYHPRKRIVEKELINRVNMQKELLAAIRSNKYYPNNDYLKAKFGVSHLDQQDLIIYDK